MTELQTSLEPSPALLEAQAQLDKLRTTLRAELDAQSQQPLSKRRERAANAPGSAPIDLGQALLAERRRREARAQGERASDVLKASLPSKPPPWSWPPLAASETPPSGSRPHTHRSVKVYPSIAVAVLEAELAAPGRVYWLFRHLDSQGRGWLWVEEVRAKLTAKK